MPGPARPIAPYMLADPGGNSRGQRRGILRVDGRTKAGRQLRATRKALLDHLGPNASAPQLALAERAAFLELRATLFDQKIVDGTFTELDGKTYYALIGALRRCYAAIGLQRPAPAFAALMRPPGRQRRTEDAA